MNDIINLESYVLRKQSDKYKELTKNGVSHNEATDRAGKYDFVLEVIQDFKEEHLSIWDQRVWISTYEDVAMAYRKIHGMEFDEPFTEDQKEQVLQIARDAEKLLEPYDWHYQVETFVEQSERLMKEKLDK